MSESAELPERVEHPDGSVSFPAMAARLEAYMNDPANDPTAEELAETTRDLEARGFTVDADGYVHNPVTVRYELGSPLVSRDGSERVEVPWGEGALTLSADDAARMFPDLYTGLSIGKRPDDGED